MFSCADAQQQHCLSHISLAVPFCRQMSNVQYALDALTVMPGSIPASARGGFGNISGRPLVVGSGVMTRCISSSCTADSGILLLNRYSCTGAACNGSAVEAMAEVLRQAAADLCPTPVPLVDSIQRFMEAALFITPTNAIPQALSISSSAVFECGALGYVAVSLSISGQYRKYNVRWPAHIAYNTSQLRAAMGIVQRSNFSLVGVVSGVLVWPSSSASVPDKMIFKALDGNIFDRSFGAGRFLPDSVLSFATNVMTARKSWIQIDSSISACAFPSQEAGKLPTANASRVSAILNEFVKLYSTGDVVTDSVLQLSGSLPSAKVENALLSYATTNVCPTLNGFLSKYLRSSLPRAQLFFSANGLQSSILVDAPIQACSLNPELDASTISILNTTDEQLTSSLLLQHPTLVGRLALYFGTLTPPPHLASRSCVNAIGQISLCLDPYSEFSTFSCNNSVVSNGIVYARTLVVQLRPSPSIPDSSLLFDELNLTYIASSQIPWSHDSVQAVGKLSSSAAQLVGQKFVLFNTSGTVATDSSYNLPSSSATSVNNIVDLFLTNDYKMTPIIMNVSAFGHEKLWSQLLQDMTSLFNSAPTGSSVLDLSVQLQSLFLDPWRSTTVAAVSVQPFTAIDLNIPGAITSFYKSTSPGILVDLRMHQLDWISLDQQRSAWQTEIATTGLQMPMIYQTRLVFALNSTAGEVLEFSIKGTGSLSTSTIPIPSMLGMQIITNQPRFKNFLTSLQSKTVNDVLSWQESNTPALVPRIPNSGESGGLTISMNLFLPINASLNLRISGFSSFRNDSVTSLISLSRINGSTNVTQQYLQSKPVTFISPNEAVPNVGGSAGMLLQNFALGPMDVPIAPSAVSYMRQSSINSIAGNMELRMSMPVAPSAGILLNTVQACPSSDFHFPLLINVSINNEAPIVCSVTSGDLSSIDSVANSINAALLSCTNKMTDYFFVGVTNRSSDSKCGMLGLIESVQGAVWNLNVTADPMNSRFSFTSTTYQLSKMPIASSWNDLSWTLNGFVPFSPYVPPNFKQVPSLEIPGVMVPKLANVYSQELWMVDIPFEILVPDYFTTRLRNETVDASGGLVIDAPEAYSIVAMNTSLKGKLGFVFDSNPLGATGIATTTDLKQNISNLSSPVPPAPNNTFSIAVNATYRTANSVREVQFLQTIVLTPGISVQQALVEEFPSQLPPDLRALIMVNISNQSTSRASVPQATIIVGAAMLGPEEWLVPSSFSLENVTFPYLGAFFRSCPTYRVLAGGININLHASLQGFITPNPRNTSLIVGILPGKVANVSLNGVTDVSARMLNSNMIIQNALAALRSKDLFGEFSVILQRNATLLLDGLNLTDASVNIYGEGVDAAMVMHQNETISVKNASTIGADWSPAVVVASNLTKKKLDLLLTLRPDHLCRLSRQISTSLSTWLNESVALESDLPGGDTSLGSVIESELGSTFSLMAGKMCVGQSIPLTTKQFCSLGSELFGSPICNKFYFKDSGTASLVLNFVEQAAKYQQTFQLDFPGIYNRTDLPKSEMNGKGGIDITTNFNSTFEFIFTLEGSHSFGHNSYENFKNFDVPSSIPSAKYNLPTHTAGASEYVYFSSPRDPLHMRMGSDTQSQFEFTYTTSSNMQVRIGPLPASFQQVLLNVGSPSLARVSWSPQEDGSRFQEKITGSGSFYADVSILTQPTCSLQLIFDDLYAYLVHRTAKVYSDCGEGDSFEDILVKALDAASLYGYLQGSDSFVNQFQNSIDSLRANIFDDSSVLGLTPLPLVDLRMHAGVIDRLNLLSSAKVLKGLSSTLNLQMSGLMGTMITDENILEQESLRILVSTICREIPGIVACPETPPVTKNRTYKIPIHISLDYHDNLPSIVFDIGTHGKAELGLDCGIALTLKLNIDFVLLYTPFKGFNITFPINPFLTASAEFDFLPACTLSGYIGSIGADIEAAGFFRAALAVYYQENKALTSWRGPGRWQLSRSQKHLLGSHFRATLELSALIKGHSMFGYAGPIPNLSKLKEALQTALYYQAYTTLSWSWTLLQPVTAPKFHLDNLTLCTGQLIANMIGSIDDDVRKFMDPVRGFFNVLETKIPITHFLFGHDLTIIELGELLAIGLCDSSSRCGLYDMMIALQTLDDVYHVLETVEHVLAEFSEPRCGIFHLLGCFEIRFDDPDPIPKRTSPPPSDQIQVQQWDEQHREVVEGLWHSVTVETPTIGIFFPFFKELHAPLFEAMCSKNIMLMALTMTPFSVVIHPPAFVVPVWGPVDFFLQIAIGASFGPFEFAVFSNGIVEAAVTGDIGRLYGGIGYYTKDIVTGADMHLYNAYVILSAGFGCNVYFASIEAFAFIQFTATGDFYNPYNEVFVPLSHVAWVIQDGDYTKLIKSHAGFDVGFGLVVSVCFHFWRWHWCFDLVHWVLVMPIPHAQWDTQYGPVPPKPADSGIVDMSTLAIPGFPPSFGLELRNSNFSRSDIVGLTSSLWKSFSNHGDFLFGDGSSACITDTDALARATMQAISAGLSLGGIRASAWRYGPFSVRGGYVNPQMPRILLVTMPNSKSTSIAMYAPDLINTGFPARNVEFPTLASIDYFGTTATPFLYDIRFVQPPITGYSSRTLTFVQMMMSEYDTTKFSFSSTSAIANDGISGGLHLTACNQGLFLSPVDFASVSFSGTFCSNTFLQTLGSSSVVFTGHGNAYAGTVHLISETGLNGGVGNVTVQVSEPSSDISSVGVLAGSLNISLSALPKVSHITFIGYNGTKAEISIHDIAEETRVLAIGNSQLNIFHIPSFVSITGWVSIVGGSKIDAVSIAAVPPGPFSVLIGSSSTIMTVQKTNGQLDIHNLNYERIINRDYVFTAAPGTVNNISIGTVEPEAVVNLTVISSKNTQVFFDITGCQTAAALRLNLLGAGNHTLIFGYRQKLTSFSCPVYIYGSDDHSQFVLLKLQGQADTDQLIWETGYHTLSGDSTTGSKDYNFRLNYFNVDRIEVNLGTGGSMFTYRRGTRGTEMMFMAPNSSTPWQAAILNTESAVMFSNFDKVVLGPTAETGNNTIDPFSNMHAAIFLSNVGRPGTLITEAGAAISAPAQAYFLSGQCFDPLVNDTGMPQKPCTDAFLDAVASFGFSVPTQPHISDCHVRYTMGLSFDITTGPKSDELVMVDVLTNVVVNLAGSDDTLKATSCSGRITSRLGPGMDTFIAANISGTFNVCDLGDDEDADTVKVVAPEGTPSLVGNIIGPLVDSQPDSIITLENYFFQDLVSIGGEAIGAEVLINATVPDSIVSFTLQAHTHYRIVYMADHVTVLMQPGKNARNWTAHVDLAYFSSSNLIDIQGNAGGQGLLILDVPRAEHGQFVSLDSVTNSLTVGNLLIHTTSADHVMINASVAAVQILVGGVPASAELVVIGDPSGNTNVSIGRASNHMAFLNASLTISNQAAIGPAIALALTAPLSSFSTIYSTNPSQSADMQLLRGCITTLGSLSPVKRSLSLWYLSFVVSSMHLSEYSVRNCTVAYSKIAALQASAYQFNILNAGGGLGIDRLSLLGQLNVVEDSPWLSAHVSSNSIQINNATIISLGGGYAANFSGPLFTSQSSTMVNCSKPDSVFDVKLGKVLWQFGIMPTKGISLSWISSFCQGIFAVQPTSELARGNNASVSLGSVFYDAPVDLVSSMGSSGNARGNSELQIAVHIGPALNFLSANLNVNVSETYCTPSGANLICPGDLNTSSTRGRKQELMVRNSVQNHGIPLMKTSVSASTMQIASVMAPGAATALSLQFVQSHCNVFLQNSSASFLSTMEVDDSSVVEISTSSPDFVVHIPGQTLWDAATRSFSRATSTGDSCVKPAVDCTDQMFLDIQQQGQICRSGCATNTFFTLVTPLTSGHVLCSPNHLVVGGDDKDHSFSDRNNWLMSTHITYYLFASLAVLLYVYSLEIVTCLNLLWPFMVAAGCFALNGGTWVDVNRLLCDAVRETLSSGGEKTTCDADSNVTVLGYTWLFSFVILVIPVGILITFMHEQLYRREKDAWNLKIWNRCCGFFCQPLLYIFCFLRRTAVSITFFLLVFIMFAYAKTSTELAIVVSCCGMLGLAALWDARDATLKELDREWAAYLKSADASALLESPNTIQDDEESERELVPPASLTDNNEEEKRESSESAPLMGWPRSRALQSKGRRTYRELVSSVLLSLTWSTVFALLAIAVAVVLQAVTFDETDSTKQVLFVGLLMFFSIILPFFSLFRAMKCKRFGCVATSIGFAVAATSAGAGCTFVVLMHLQLENLSDSIVEGLWYFWAMGGSLLQFILQSHAIWLGARRFFPK